MKQQRLIFLSEPTNGTATTSCNISKNLRLLQTPETFRANGPIISFRSAFPSLLRESGSLPCLTSWGLSYIGIALPGIFPERRYPKRPFDTAIPCHRYESTKVVPSDRNPNRNNCPPLRCRRRELQNGCYPTQIKRLCTAKKYVKGLGLILCHE